MLTPKAIQEARFSPALECLSINDLGLLLGQLAVGEIPGFIVRADLSPDKVAAEQVHDVLTEKIHQQAQRDDHKYSMPTKNSTFVGFGQEPVGRLHHDASDESLNEYYPSIPFMNTTKNGGGRILIAGIGSNLVHNISYPRRPENVPNHPHNLLVRGLVDTQLMRREVYYADVKEGDSLVANALGPNATWHRFDTDLSLGERTVVVSDFLPAA